MILALDYSQVVKMILVFGVLFFATNRFSIKQPDEKTACRRNYMELLTFIPFKFLMAYQNNFELA
jgi:hypothetical protein